MLRRLPPFPDDKLLTPSGRVEDAAAYLLDAERVLLFSADFFTPIVDDPFTFGRIAAANALSDIYAMGGAPALALNLAAFPASEYGTEALSEILAGGADTLKEAGCLLGGGHTIDDPEPKYGLAVVGFARRTGLLRKCSARSNDILYLTKSIGTGILSTAFKGSRIGEAEMAEAVASMTALNRRASEAALGRGVRAATDVTGFGLLGHLMEICEESGVGAEVEFSKLPFFAGVEALALEGEVPGGTVANRDAVLSRLEGAHSLPSHHLLMACDAQTSGGLLLAVPEGEASRLESDAVSAGFGLWRIGRILPGPPRICLVH